jgi:hypothetical protein
MIIGITTSEDGCDTDAAIGVLLLLIGVYMSSLPSSADRDILVSHQVTVASGST